MKTIHSPSRGQGLLVLRLSAIWLCLLFSPAQLIFQPFQAVLPFHTFQPLHAFQPCHANAAEPEYGGSLTYVGEIGARGFDAIKVRSLVGGGRGVAVLVMEKLFKRGEQGELIPVLGLSATNSSDGKTWVIKLRQGINFHDGTPFNADAVVQHWQRILNPENRFRMLLLLRPIESVEKTGEFEVTFHLKHGWSPFTSFLTMPGAFTSLIPSPTAVANDTHNFHPVGTGPFVFKEWKRGSHITVTKNPDYWQQGKPYLDEFVFRAIPDHETRYATLASGQADLIITDRPTHVKKLQEDENFITYPLIWRGAGIFALNTQTPPLDDVRVRRAMALAWDQKKYLSMSYKNIMPFTEHWFGPDLNCGDIGYPAPDPAKAQDLIAEVGEEVELEYVHTATNRGKEAGVIVQQLMKQAGIKITPVPSDFPGIVKRLMTKQYDLISWLIFGAYDMGPITEAILHSKSPMNVTGYSDEEMDKMLMALRVTTDSDKRKELMCQIARKVNSDVPFLFIFGRTYYLFARNTIKNVTLPVLGEEGLDLSELWIDH